MSTAKYDITAGGFDPVATVATPHDSGAGRIQLGQAAAAGLILDERTDAFEQANPARGGDPRTLNVAALVDEHCVVKCTWTRTITATTDGTWSITHTPQVQASPLRFSLGAGESQEITVTASAEGVASGDFDFGRVEFQPEADALPLQSIPVSLRSVRSNLPARVDILAQADEGSSMIEDVRSVEIESLSTQVGGLVRAATTTLTVEQDSNSNPTDTDEGIVYQFFEVPDNARTFVVEAGAMQAGGRSNIDLFLGIDFDGDGAPSGNEFLCVARTAGDADEECMLKLATFRTEGQPLPPVWALVHGIELDGPTEVRLHSALITDEDASNFTAEGPQTPVESLGLFDVSLTWNESMELGDVFFAEIDFFAGPKATRDNALGSTLVRLERVEETEGEGSTGEETSVGTTDEGDTTSGDDSSPTSQTVTSDSSTEDSGAEDDSGNDNGCACTTTGEQHPKSMGALLLLGIGLTTRRRRKTRLAMV